MSAIINTLWKLIVIGKLVTGLGKCLCESICECVSCLYPVCAWAVLNECCTGGIDDNPIEELYINPLWLWVLVALRLQFPLLPLHSHTHHTNHLRLTDTSVCFCPCSTIHTHCTLSQQIFKNSVNPTTRSVHGLILSKCYIRARVNINKVHISSICTLIEHFSPETFDF